MSSWTATKRNNFCTKYEKNVLFEQYNRVIKNDAHLLKKTSTPFESGLNELADSAV